MKVDLRPIPAAKLGRPARRPACCVLENAALRRLGIDVMEPWQEALQRYLFARNQLSALSFQL
jgi:dTDP-4-dehydrorhamnose reductase